MLKRLGSWDEAWRAPGCSPIAYLDRLGFWGERTLAVHAVQATDEDLRILAGRGATVVTCPRSNVHVGVGQPPVSRFYASGVPVAVGTDSLSSVDDLNLFSELAPTPSDRPGCRARAAAGERDIRRRAGAGRRAATSGRCGRGHGRL